LRAYFYYRFKNGLDLFWQQGLYFHEEYVKHRKWLDEKTDADLVALCQFFSQSCQQLSWHRYRYNVRQHLFIKKEM
jgi:hypothetical protein